MKKRNAGTILALVFAATASGTSLAASTQTCEVKKQIVTDSKGATWTEPVVMCKNDKGEPEIRPIEHYLTIGGKGNSPEDQVITGYNISPKGEVTIFYLGDKDSNVEISNCKTVTKSHYFWTSNTTNLSIFQAVIENETRNAKKSKRFTENFTSAILNIQNSVATECMIKGLAKPIEAPSAPTKQEECSPEFVKPVPRKPAPIEI